MQRGEVPEVVDGVQRALHVDVVGARADGADRPVPAQAGLDRVQAPRAVLPGDALAAVDDPWRVGLVGRAAAALSRYYPGGRPAFIAAMNAKAKSLGMTDTHFENSTGLTSLNVSSARDLVKMVNAAYQYPLIRKFSTDRRSAECVALS